MKVLVVDSYETAAEQIKNILLSKNYEVETADNGALALDKYLKFKPDIVTLEITMPIMDGYEALTRLMKLDKNANVIMVTSVENEELLQKCLERGALGYVTKPFTPNELTDIIVNLWKSSANRNVVLLFSRVIDKIHDIFEKRAGLHVTVSLKDVEVIHVSHSPRVITSESRIVAVPAIAQDKPVIPEGFTGYVTEINGQDNGVIISWIRMDDLNALREESILKGKEIGDSRMELFTILNDKVLAELVAATNLRLNPELLRLYDQTKDQDIAIKKDLTKAKYELAFKELKIPLEIHLYLNTEGLYKIRF